MLSGPSCILAFRGICFHREMYCVFDRSHSCYLEKSVTNARLGMMTGELRKYGSDFETAINFPLTMAVSGVVEFGCDYEPYRFGLDYR